MNGWDVFTWTMVVILAGGAFIVFGFFLKDVGGVLRGMDANQNKVRDSEEEPPRPGGGRA
jgi:hypothetical protein